MKDLSDIMRQAQQMQQRLQEAQERMDQITADGTSGGGMVKVTLKGKGELHALAIDPSLHDAGRQGDGGRPHQGGACRRAPQAG